MSPSTTSCCGKFSTVCTFATVPAHTVPANIKKENRRFITPAVYTEPGTTTRKKRSFHTGTTLKKNRQADTLSKRSAALSTDLLTGNNRKLLDGSLHGSLVLVAAVTGGHGAQRGHRLRLTAARAETYCAGHCKNESGGFHKKKMSYEVIARSKADLFKIVNTLFYEQAFFPFKPGIFTCVRTICLKRAHVYGIICPPWQGEEEKQQFLWIAASELQENARRRF